MTKYYPEAAVHFCERAVSLVADGNLDDAWKYFNLSLQYQPRAATYLQRARMHQKSGDFERCQADIKFAFELLDAEYTAAAGNDLRQQLLDLQVEIEPLLAVEKKAAAAQKSIEDKKKRLAKMKDALGLLELCGLREFTNALVQLSKPSTRLISERRCSPDAICSRFGGIPLVPKGFQWPLSEVDLPLSFLCQLDLADLQGYYAGTQLPKAGFLSFFYDEDNLPSAYGPGPHNGWKVFLFTDARKLFPPKSRRNCPSSGQFVPASISFVDDQTYPADDDKVLDNLNMSVDDRQAYSKFTDLWHQTSKPIHRVFGDAQTQQQHLIAVLKSEAVKAEDFQTLALLDGSRLLLQLDSDILTNMEWGDSGRLYFCIDELSLRAADFANVWVTWQCF